MKKLIRSKWVRLIFRIASLFPCRLIRGVDGKLYLARYTMFGDGGNETPADPKQRARFSLFLHYFARPDIDRELHSHPWKWSFSFVLSGGYWEKRTTVFGRNTEFDKRVIKAQSNWFIPTEHFRAPFRFNFFREGDFHRITKIKPGCWTLFFAGPKISDWGFLVRGRGVVGHETYFRERGEI